MKTTIFILSLTYLNLTIASDQAIVEKDIRSLSPNLEKSEIIFTHLKSGDSIAIAKSSSMALTMSVEKEKLTCTFLSKIKGQDKWSIAGEFSDEKNANDCTIKNEIVKIKSWRKGERKIDGELSWRLEDGAFKVIGEDLHLRYPGSEPFRIDTSLNYITGKGFADYFYFDLKKSQDAKKHLECLFDPSVYRSKTFSDITKGAFNLPSCLDPINAK
jgi:hypothetical protein